MKTRLVKCIKENEKKKLKYKKYYLRIQVSDTDFLSRHRFFNLFNK